MSWSCEGEGHNEENETLTQIVNNAGHPLFQKYCCVAKKYR